MKFYLLIFYLFIGINQIGLELPRVYIETERNPLSKLNSLNHTKIWTLGREGTSTNPKFAKDTLLIIIKASSLNQFKKINDKTLIDAFAIVTGKLTKHQNHLQLILTDQTNLYLKFYKKSASLY